MNYTAIIKKCVLAYVVMVIIMCLFVYTYEHRFRFPMEFDIEHLLMFFVSTYISSRYVLKDKPSDFLFRILSFDYLVFTYYSFHDVQLVSFLLISFVLWILIELFLIIRRKINMPSFFYSVDSNKGRFWTQVYNENKIFIIILLAILACLGIDNMLDFFGFTNPDSTAFRSFVFFIALLVIVGTWLFFVFGITVIFSCAKLSRRYFKNDEQWLLVGFLILIFASVVMVFIVNQ